MEKTGKQTKGWKIEMNRLRAIISNLRSIK